MRRAKGVPVIKCREFFPRRNEARIGECDKNRGLRQSCQRSECRRSKGESEQSETGPSLGAR